MGYRLGLDMGSNSIGWCVLKLDAQERPCELLDAGVRLLTPNEEAGRDPQSKSSLASNRRAARSARRRRDRFLRRRKRVMALLIEGGLMPADAEARKALEPQDPYWLRSEALDRRLEPHEVGRAIFHLNQRRGFKSNRIADSDDSEKSAMKVGMRELEQRLTDEGMRTLGEFLASRHKRDRSGRRLKDGQSWSRPESVRFRPRSQGTKNLYDFYPTRELVRDELRKIWHAQQAHHPELTAELLGKLEYAIIEQRPLRKPPVGRCTLRPEASIVTSDGLEVDEGERAPKAHPLFQRFRILQDVCQLRVTRAGRGERHLTLGERDAIVGTLMSRSGNLVSFEAMRKAIKLPDDARFNYELAGRTGLQPDQTGAKLGAGKAIGKAWRSFSRERQIAVVERLLAVEDPQELTEWLCETLNIEEDLAERLSELRLPQGHGRFGRSILRDLIEVMETGGREAVDGDTGEIFQRPLSYDEAVDEISLHHSDLRPSRRGKLPYYGQALARHVIARPAAPEGSQEAIGRVPNPTVHIGLNQLRKIVNCLIDLYGPPQEIVIELARELKLNQERKEEEKRKNRDNKNRNDAIKGELAELGLADSHDARLRMRLFHELPAAQKVCVFSGETLSLSRLFDGSVEVEHILPHSATLDDSFMNKVLCTREMNRKKGRRAPADVWSGDILQKIVERAEQLFPRKAWRFQPDAMERFREDGDFLARQLTDTQHMSRLAQTYLQLVCDQVWASPGRLTAMLRAKWGLNALLPDHNYPDVKRPKNRRDHRHHAIDAFVVACTDRGLLNRIARASGQAEALELDRLFPKESFPEPFSGFRDALAARLETIVVSHKPDHGVPPDGREGVHATSGQLHEATAYGTVREEVDGNVYNLVTRKAIDALSPGEIKRVRDKGLREALLEVEKRADQQQVKLSEALSAFGQAQGIRRVRILKAEKSVRVIRHGGFEKAYVPGDNHRIEIFERPDGQWDGEGVAVFDANQPGFVPRWRERYPNARLVMRVHNGDLIEGDFGEGQRLMRVYRLEPSAKRIRLAGHQEAGSINDRHNDQNDPLRWVFGTYARLQEAGAHRVRVDPIGRVTLAEDRP